MGRGLCGRRRWFRRYALGVSNGVLLAARGIDLGFQRGGDMAQTTAVGSCHGGTAQCGVWLHEVESIKVELCCTAFVVLALRFGLLEIASLLRLHSGSFVYRIRDDTSFLSSRKAMSYSKHSYYADDPTAKLWI